MPTICFDMQPLYRNQKYLPCINLSIYLEGKIEVALFARTSDGAFNASLRLPGDPENSGALHYPPDCTHIRGVARSH